MALESHPLHPFLAPRSVAIVGVSPNWSYVNSILQQIIALKAPEHVYPVNPNYPEVAGLPAYPRLTDIPGDVELALIAVKNDVTEEIDRLTAHVGAARGLLAETGQVGRKFDFLMQEFMREANTLCSKSQSLALTRIGLDLKTVIDQMREQVQNVE